MATTLGTIRTNARVHLIETTANFWTDAELLEHIQQGVKDLWRAVVDLHQEHFLTVDETNVSQAASATSLTGVPSDCYRVHIIEPRDTTDTGSSKALIYQPKDYNSKEFVGARSLGTQDPTSAGVIYYTLTQAGAPVAAPTVLVAPKLSAAALLRFVYVPTLSVAAMTASDNNPIPGESDNALKAWCVAYGRAKEREDRSPDPNWLAVYATEKANILTSLTPRQTQEPEVVEGLFEDYWP